MQNGAFLFIIITAFFLFSCNDNKEQKIIRPQSDHSVGMEFYLDNIVDTSGRPVKLDYSKSELTLLDFWNHSCPPCIEEMRQFPGLLKGKEKKISIVSISLTQFYIWRKTMENPGGTFAFLKDSTPGWSYTRCSDSINFWYRSFYE